MAGGQYIVVGLIGQCVPQPWREIDAHGDGATDSKIFF